MDERRRVRNARARPLIESMHLWLLTSLGKLSRKSDTAAAIHYPKRTVGNGGS
jgi:transposase